MVNTNHNSVEECNDAVWLVKITCCYINQGIDDLDVICSTSTDYHVRSQESRKSSVSGIVTIFIFDG